MGTTLRSLGRSETNEQPPGVPSGSRTPSLDVSSNRSGGAELFRLNSGPKARVLGICRLLSMHRVSTTQTYAEILLIQDSDADRNRGSNLSITLQAIVLAILGFTWGGWVTSGTAALARTWWPGPPMQESAGSGSSVAVGDSNAVRFIKVAVFSELRRCRQAAEGRSGLYRRPLMRRWRDNATARSGLWLPGQTGRRKAHRPL